MERDEAVLLLEQALNRLQFPQPNANGGVEQIGGAYWRVAKVLARYLNPRLEDQEGAKHARFIRETHGVLVRRPPGLAADSTLLQQALDALEYHREQTRPIERTELAIAALRAALATQGGGNAITITAVCEPGRPAVTWCRASTSHMPEQTSQP